MTTSAFVHLHNHTDYSLLDSTIRIPRLIAKAKEFAMPAVAITDSNNMCGVIEFYIECLKAGIKPIIGAEVSVTSVLPAQDKRPEIFKVVLLCMDLAGYRNLCRIVSVACSKGLRLISPVTPGILAAHSEGLICLSGGIEGELTVLSRQNGNDAMTVAAWYREHFPKRYYIELLPEPSHALTSLMLIARTLQIPLVAACDCRFLIPEGSKAYKVLQCIKTGTILEKIDNETGSLEPLFHSPAEMRELFCDCPEALENTVKIADSCQLELPIDKDHVLRYESPDGMSTGDLLEQMAWQGLKARIVTIRALNPAITKDQVHLYHERLRFELNSITSKKHTSYFLIIADYVNWAKNQGIPVGPGRGSVGGSLVAYALKITEIDPIPLGLFYECLVNQDRMLPDMSLDFCMDRRDEVIKYMIRRYSKERVCKAATFATASAKWTMQKAGEVLRIKNSDIGKVLKLLPKQDSGDRLAEVLARTPKLKLNRLAETNAQIQELVSLTCDLEGQINHVSKHAARIMIAPVNVREFIPVTGDPEGGISISQVPFQYVERMALVRFDLLGLQSLTTNDAVVKRIRVGKNPDLDLQLLPLDDKATFELISSGDTEHISQLVSSDLNDLLMQLKPSCFEDLVAACALYRLGRPGIGIMAELIERKRGLQPVSYVLPELEPILANTYGMLIYQEQFVQIIQKVAGYSVCEADILQGVLGRRAVNGFKIEKKVFIAGAGVRGIAQDRASELFEKMVYSKHLCIKANAVSSALIAYQSAWLKTHYLDVYINTMERIDQHFQKAEL